MHKPNFIIIVVVGIGVAMFGCNSKESEVKEGVGANLDSVAVGMKLNQLLTVLRDHEIEVEKVDLGGVMIGEKEGWSQYIVKPKYESDDALVLLVVKEKETTSDIITEMHWHLGYDRDFLLPKGDRADRTLSLQSLDVSVLLPHEGEPNIQPAQSDDPF